MAIDLSVKIAGIIMQNPVMNAAGTLDIEPLGVKDLVQTDKLGAYVQKSITLKPREGNNQPRTYEVEGGMINRIGLQNVGVVAFIRNKLPVIHMSKPINVPLIVSVAGESVESYLWTSIILETKSRGMISALEINISCPNVENGMAFGTDPDLTYELVGNLKARIRLPLIVKLTPNVENIGLIAEAAVAAGADALSLINTVKEKAFIERGPNAGQWIEGGLSGPVIKPTALAKVREVSKAVDIPIIAMGGICNTADALEFLRIKNVWAIAVGTATFIDPTTMVKIVEGLGEYFMEKGYANMREFNAREVR